MGRVQHYVPDFCHLSPLSLALCHGARICWAGWLWFSTVGSQPWPGILTAFLSASHAPSSRWRPQSRPIRMHSQAPATCWTCCYKKTLAPAQAPRPQAPWALAWALALGQDPMKGEAPQPVLLVSDLSGISRTWEVGIRIPVWPTLLRPMGWHMV